MKERIRDTPPPFSAAQVLFEDNHLIVINKLPGQIVQGDKTGDISLTEALKVYIGRKYQKPGNVFVGTVHRIDRPVSGVVIFARTSKALSRLNEFFRNRSVRKVYWAVVKEKPPAGQAKLVDYLRKNESKNQSFVVKENTSNALRSELEYRLLASSENYHLLEVEPLTGRHHQIRVQLSAMGCPIKGDLKYGSKRSNPDGSIHLHARMLELPHPTCKDKLTFTAEPPNESLWNALVRLAGKVSHE